MDAYKDFFKWNRELFEDDWNDGKGYVAKLKAKSSGVVSIMINVLTLI